MMVAEMKGMADIFFRHLLAELLHHRMSSIAGQEDVVMFSSL